MSEESVNQKLANVLAFLLEEAERVHAAFMNDFGESVINETALSAARIILGDIEDRRIPEIQNADADKKDRQAKEDEDTRALAAIVLKVPDSGKDWIDDMIRKAKRDALAGQALVGILSLAVDFKDATTASERAKLAYLHADAMMEARDAMLPPSNEKCRQ